MRVSMSAMVSLCISALPARLLDARDEPERGVPAEADPAHAELPHERARTPAQRAAVVLLRPELRRSERFRNQGLLGHWSPRHAVSAVMPTRVNKPPCGSLLVRLAEGHAE